VRCGVKSDVAPRVMQNLTLTQKRLALRVYRKSRVNEETEIACCIKNRNKNKNDDAMGITTDVVYAKRPVQNMKRREHRDKTRSETKTQKLQSMPLKNYKLYLSVCLPT